MKKKPIIKEKIVGRGFTKKVVKELVPHDSSEEADLEVQAAMFQLWSEFADGPTSFRKLRAHQVEWARAILRGSGLPDEFWVYYRGPDGTNWTIEPPPEGAKEYGGATIKHFVINKMGYAHDSDEGFAARILQSAFWSRKANREQALLGAFEMGRASAEARSYEYQRRSGRERRTPVNSAKEKAFDLLGGLCKRLDRPSAEVIWGHVRRLAIEERNLGEGASIEFEESGGGERLTFYSRDHEWTCARGSFDKFYSLVKKRELDTRP